MEKLQFDITIDAPRQTVWNVLFNDDTYRQWTAPFCEGSYAETDWQQGSRARFLSPDGGGMVSEIAERREPEFLSIRHLGEVKNFVDQPIDPATPWYGATEDYRLEESGAGTVLYIELAGLDGAEEHKDYFLKAWPLALEKVRSLSESATVTA